VIDIIAYLEEVP